MGITRDQTGTHGGAGMQVGIDPAGGADHTAESVLYGDWWSSRMEEWSEGQWREVTVFPRLKCDFPVDINASHWDDFELLVGEPDEIHPPEPETDVPVGDLTLEQLEPIIRRIVREELGDA